MEPSYGMGETPVMEQLTKIDIPIVLPITGSSVHTYKNHIVFNIAW
jgi:hypothetical protein